MYVFSSSEQMDDIFDDEYCAIRITIERLSSIEIFADVARMSQYEAVIIFKMFLDSKPCWQKGN